VDSAGSVVHVVGRTNFGRSSAPHVHGLGHVGFRLTGCTGSAWRRAQHGDGMAWKRPDGASWLPSKTITRRQLPRRFSVVGYGGSVPRSSGGLPKDGHTRRTKRCKVQLSWKRRRNVARGIDATISMAAGFSSESRSPLQ
jgi:hypothetical protein